MTPELIIENYNKLCPNLDEFDNPTPKDFQAISQLSQFTIDGQITDSEIVRAFKKANENDFLCGRKNNFKAKMIWIVNPVNIKNILDGKYDDNNSTKNKRPSLDNNRKYDFDELEKNILEETRKNAERLRNNPEFRKSLEEWVVKYPNMQPLLD